MPAPASPVAPNGPVSPDPTIDVARLERELRAQIRGAVRSDAATRAMYSADASNYRVPPLLVVSPEGTDDLAAALAIVAEAGAPAVLRGGGTSMAGNAIGGVLLDTTHLSALTLDPATGRATAEPGVVLGHLNERAAVHGLRFAVDPSSASRATIGGMLANNACGAHSVAWGTTADNLCAVRSILADGTTLDWRVPDANESVHDRMSRLATLAGREGELHRGLQALAAREERVLQRRFPDLRRRISGYSLDRLRPERGYDVARMLCGSEGTLAVITEAELTLVRPPAATVLLVAGFTSGVEAARAVPPALPCGPLTMESINAELVDRLPAGVRSEAVAAGLPAGRFWLLIDVGAADETAARIQAEDLLAAVRDAGVTATASIVTDPGARAALWRCRRDGTGLATRRADGQEAWAGWEDAAVPPDRLGEYLSELDTLLARFKLSGSSYGHFGEGCMHMRCDFDLFSDDGVRTYRAFVEQATDLVVRLGGSVSGEHGDGRARSELLARMYGADVVALFGAVKDMFDPRGVLNPGVIARPRPLDENLRLHRTAGRELPTVLGYPADHGSFAQAQRRCVGVAKCRQSAGGVMCPSYQVTGEEQHSTRGRARLLWEMVEGSTITKGWRSPEVRDALDLCLSCKGCLSDCPVNVDMATYKAEFFHHFYKWRLRPRSHYSMGWLPLWALLASFAPRLVNLVLRSPASRLLKLAGGLAGARALPQFARRTFVRAHRRMRGGAPSGWTPGGGAADRGPVVLWPDSFTNHFAPQVGHAAVQVLTAAGFEVIVPERRACCGLTWISTGQLQVARRILRRTMDVLEPYLERGLPLVVLEPSCLAVFRHDGPTLLPDDPRARLAQEHSHSLAETLATYAPDWTPPQVGADALVQTHCHQHAVIGFDADRALMAAAGIRATVPDSGCCGLAGNFGFEAEHYEISRAVGERVLLPAVRDAAADTLIVADGFSCRTQIAGETPRTARHLAELLAEALGRSPR